MMEVYSLVYVDDNPEIALSRYLDKAFRGDSYEIKFSEIIFKPEDGYISLLTNPVIQSANIIIIDSWLFENRTARSAKFTGEEFKLILRKLFPFIEVIVITQNGVEPLEALKVAKYDKSFGGSASRYYEMELTKVINSAVENIRQYRFMADLVKKNDSWEAILKEKVLSTLDGTSAYDELTKSDIDNLIVAFKEFKRGLNER